MWGLVSCEAEGYQWELGSDPSTLETVNDLELSETARILWMLAREDDNPSPRATANLAVPRDKVDSRTRTQAAGWSSARVWARTK